RAGPPSRADRAPRRSPAHADARARCVRRRHRSSARFCRFGRDPSSCRICPLPCPPMRAFVTGGTGFIGSRVIKRLRDRGDEVVALVRTPSKATELLNQGVELVEGDLSSADAIKGGVDGVDGVFHIGAVYKVG